MKGDKVEFLLRTHSSENGNLEQPRAVCFRQPIGVPDFFPWNDLDPIRGVDQIDSQAHISSRLSLIARHHNDPYARISARRYRLADVTARWIDQTNKAKENQLVIRFCIDSCHLFRSQGQYTKSLLSHLLIALQPPLTVCDTHSPVTLDRPDL